MALRWQTLCVDSADPERVAAFWEAALGWHRAEETLDEIVLVPPPGSPHAEVVPELLFGRVPEHKVAVKNRLHIDLRPDRDQAEEVARLEALGATRIDIGQGEQTWVVMADPDGNEFCVLRVLTPDELAAG